ncbi:MAG: 2-dehydropantoate 2-reductase [Dehalococcoidia bacterium]|nr:2-dehydropantoate 2-reductase [Dehalococcoidia bacterium]
MRIAVMGAGSTGGYFGGMLSRGGHDVSLVARGAQLEAIRANGLLVVRDDDEFTVQCLATDDPAKIGPVDLVLLCVKTYQNETAIPLMVPLVGADTTVLCLQNGVDSYLTATEILGGQAVLPGAAFIEASRLGPGQVRQTGSLVRVIFGETDGRETPRCRAIREAFIDSGIPAEVLPDIGVGQWEKFLFIATMAGVTSMARATLAELMPQSHWRKVVHACLTEIDTVARANGVNLPPTIVPRTINYIEEHLADLQASMHHDLVAGRPLELDALNGAVVRAGLDSGVPTPINDIIYAMLKTYREGA